MGEFPHQRNVRIDRHRYTNTYLYYVLGAGKASATVSSWAATASGGLAWEKRCEESRVAGLDSACEMLARPALSARFMSGGDGNPLDRARFILADDLRHYGPITLNDSAGACRADVSAWQTEYVIDL